MAKQSIGEFLATLRKANGYTQQEVADRLGISNRTLSGWECNNVLPDILLLPALSELYGVTVDELLAGERRERNEVPLSNKSEKRILKSKIVRFSAQCWLLLGLIIIGVALVAACVLIDESTLRFYGFLWWMALLAGVFLSAVCLAILFAFWKGAEVFGEDTSADYAAYRLILRKKLANCLYIISAENALALIVVASVLFASNSLQLGKLYACVVFCLVAVVLFVTGWLTYKHALVNLGGEQSHNSISKERRYFFKVGLFCAIPLLLSVVLATVLGSVRFVKRTTIYENSSVEEFVQHMESLEHLGKEYQFPLTSAIEKAAVGDEVDLGDGFVATFRWRSLVTITNEQLTIYHLNGDGSIDALPFKIEVPSVFLIDEYGIFTVYNVRYCSDIEQAASDLASRYVKYSNYFVERVGDGMAYVHEIAHDYSQIGYAVAFTVVAADLIVCAALCVTKRNKFAVKM